MSAPKIEGRCCWGRRKEGIGELTWIFIKGYTLGKLLIEGKTKRVFDLPEEKGLCMIVSKDRITAGDGVKAHDLEGKAAISTKTNGKVFELLNVAGL